MASVFARATKRRARARVAIDGPSGGGKTWNGLIYAFALAGPDGRVAAVDTERGSMSLYAPDFPPFDVVDFAPPYHPERLVTLVNMAVQEGFDVLLIDSLTHFWTGEGGTLDIVDNATVRGNSFGSGWKVGTPAQRHMMDTILAAPIHVIVTMRSKMEYVLETKDGKSVPRRVGMAPEQRAGIEYEFTVVLDFDLEHRMLVSKTRCSLLTDVVAPKERVGEWAQRFAAWLQDGADEAPPAQPDIQPTPPPSANPTNQPSAAAAVVAPAQSGPPPQKVPLDEACPNCGKTGACFHHPAQPGRYFCAASQPTTDGGHGCNSVFGDDELATARAKAAGNVTESEAAAMTAALAEGNVPEAATAAPTSEAEVPEELVAAAQPVAVAEPEPEMPAAATQEPEPPAAPAEQPAAETEPAPAASEPTADGVVVQLTPITKEQKATLAKRHGLLPLPNKCTKPEWDVLVELGYERASQVIEGLLALPPENRPMKREMRVFMALPFEGQMAELADLASRARATA